MTAIDTALSGIPRLTRARLRARDGVDLQRAPVRIVHMGLGAFHRAHQAWYTATVDSAHEWGIAAFTGRHPQGARDLEEQDGLFTLTVRGADGDESFIVPSISHAFDGADLAEFVHAVSAPRTSIVTMTITEAGYRVAPDGRLDMTDPVIAADVRVLRSGAGGDSPPLVQSAVARLVIGLAARRAAGAGPIAVVPCDNLPGNGELVRQAVLDLALGCDPGLVPWIDAEVFFVSTCVDRITPRVPADEVRRLAETTGWDDRGVVVTEPYADWVLCGSFPGGRPAWERAGARFVADIEPYERRKLWILNGAHTLLASLGQLCGHRSVADAIADPVCAQAVSDLWDEAARHLPAEELGLEEYRADLLERFGNHRIEHLLTQIADDSKTKLRVRIVPVARRERAAGRSADACALALASWSVLTDVTDDIDRELAADREFAESVASHAARLRASLPDRT